MPFGVIISQAKYNYRAMNILNVYYQANHILPGLLVRVALPEVTVKV